jgi:hypothetical protein
MAENRQENFIIAAGGTGMRCLQAFINMCAIGVFKDMKFNILLLETDEENKDKRNAEKLISTYSYLHKNAKGSFFTSELELFTFVPDYSTDETRDFVRLSQIELDTTELSTRLANIFYEQNVQEFDLSHGYKAQTHLGSYLMYHAIINEVRKAQEHEAKKASSQLYKFINLVSKSNNTGGRLFVFGSSFGGTGASSIPVMPRAISDAAALILDGSIEINNIFFGGVVLSDYFNFSPPAANQKKAEKVIANSQYFSHNSAAALNYYVHDNTILEKYKHLYLMGWPSNKKIDVDEYKEKILNIKDDGSTKTGGKHQENPCHILEVMSISAAYHFFSEAYTSTNTLKSMEKTKFLYKSLEKFGSDGLFVSPEDIIPEIDKKNNKVPSYERFIRNATSLYTLGLILQNVYNNDVTSLQKDLLLYNNKYELNEDDAEQLTYFLNYFSKSRDDAGNFRPGWFTQVFLTFNRIDNTPNKSFLGLENKLFDFKASDINWSLAHKQLLKGNPKDTLITRFKKVNQNEGGDMSTMLKHFCQTFDSFEMNLGTNEESNSITA